jgi:tetratricopeptide (TPR) repeat protein
MRRLSVAAVVLLASSQPAFAEDADTLFTEGKALLAAGQVDEACQKFEHSESLDPQLGTELNLADCREKQGRPADAYKLFVAAHKSAQLRNDPRATFARDRANGLLAEIVRVRLVVTLTPGLLVQVAGVTIDLSAKDDLIVNPGDIFIEASAAGRVPFRETRKAAGGDLVEVSVPMLAELPPPPPPPQPAMRRSRVPLVVTGVGAVIAVAGLAYGMEVDESYRALDPSEPNYDENTDLYKERRNLANAVLLVGLTTVVGGALWYLLSDADVLVSPAATPTQVGLVVGTRF